MLLIISSKEDRPELESKILAAAFRQSVERGDIDGSRLAHRELGALLSSKSAEPVPADNINNLERVFATDNLQSMDLQNFISSSQAEETAHLQESRPGSQADGNRTGISPYESPESSKDKAADHSGREQAARTDSPAYIKKGKEQRRLQRKKGRRTGHTPESAANSEAPVKSETVDAVAPALEMESIESIVPLICVDGENTGTETGEESDLESIEEFISPEIYSSIDFAEAQESITATAADSIPALIAQRPPPDPDSQNYYRWIGAEATDPFFLLHICYLHSARGILMRHFNGSGDQTLSAQDFKKQLKNMGIAFNILFDPRTRLDYDLRSIGLRQPEQGSKLNIPEDARLPESGGKARISLSELIIVSRIFNTEQMLAVANAGRLLSEKQFWDYLSESQLLSTVELDSIKTGFHLICNGLISIAQFEQAFQYVRLHQQQLLEILLAAGWLRVEELHDYAEERGPETFEAPKFVEAQIQKDAVEAAQQTSSALPDWMAWGDGEENALSSEEPQAAGVALDFFALASKAEKSLDEENNVPTTDTSENAESAERDSDKDTENGSKLSEVENTASESLETSSEESEISKTESTDATEEDAHD